MKTNEVKPVSRLKITEVMGRAKFIRHEDKMILKFDPSHLERIEDLKRVVEYFKTMVEKMPKGSLLALVDFSGLADEDEVFDQMVKLSKFCGPHVRASAIVAKDPASTRLAKAVINHFAKINMPFFEEEDSAKKWLFSQ